MDQTLRQVNFKAPPAVAPPVAPAQPVVAPPVAPAQPAVAPPPPPPPDSAMVLAQWATVQQQIHHLYQWVEYLSNRLGHRWAQGFFPFRGAGVLRGLGMASLQAFGQSHLEAGRLTVSRRRLTVKRPCL